MPRLLDDLERRLLNEFQHDFPLVPRPFRLIAERLGVAEDVVLDLLCRLQEEGYISRIGAVLEPGTAGHSTLAAMRVPVERLEEVARLVSSYREVNHNYEREHDYNLWFVVTARSRARVAAVLEDIRGRTGLPVLELPLVEAFRLDLGFPLSWD